MYVRRRRLLHLLDRAAGLPLTLVSAPAGAGKTSVVADWASREDESRRVAWVDFEDAEDADRFGPLLVEALADLDIHPLASPLGNRALDPGRYGFASLAAAVAAGPFRVTLVLDGFEFASDAVADRLDFLLRHSAGRLRVVLLTRDDSALPLYRYRLEDAVAEIRMPELAFTDDEAEALLEAAGVKLPERAVRELNERTGGWAAGLRFASLMLEQSDDPAAAVATVAGGSGDMAEFLRAEVLDVQTPRVRDLLLRTCVPAALEPGLAEELAGPSAGRELEGLRRRGNVFLGATDDPPGGLRYVPVFREFLLTRAAQESPRTLPRQHRRAARWYAGNGRLDDAVHHAVAGRAWTDAAGLVVDGLAVGRLLVRGQGDALASALRELPARVADPAACAVRAALALAAQDVQGCDAELALARAGRPDDPTRRMSLQVVVAVLRAVRAAVDDEPGHAVRLAETARRVLRTTEHAQRARRRHELEALVQRSRGQALLRAGEVARADHALMLGVQAAGPGCEPLAADCLALLALSAAFQGRLTQAKELVRAANAAADSAGLPVEERCPAAYVALAWVAAEEYDLDDGLRQAAAARRCVAFRHDRVSQTMLALVEARLQRAHGDLGAALATVCAEVGEAGPGSWLADQLYLAEAGLRVLDGGGDGAMQRLSRLRDGNEPEVALVLAQAKAAHGRAITPEDGLDRALAPDVPVTTQVPALLLKAGQELGRGRPGRARAALDRSLRLASTQTLRRPFREAGASVQRLLDEDTELAGQNGWLHGAPSVPSGRIPAQRRPPTTSRAPGARSAAWVPLVEPLTAKESEVLGHLAELLSTDEVAETMFVSVNTVRTHVRNILRKLAVSRRNDAIRRARELGLLDH